MFCLEYFAQHMKNRIFLFDLRVANSSLEHIIAILRFNFSAYQWNAEFLTHVYEMWAVALLVNEAQVNWALLCLL